MAVPISGSRKVPTHGYVTHMHTLTHMPQARVQHQLCSPCQKIRKATIPQGGTSLGASMEGRERETSQEWLWK